MFVVSFFARQLLWRWLVAVITITPVVLEWMAWGL